MKRSEIIEWLKTDDEGQLQELWQQANQVRQHHVGNEVHLRGLLEFSNNLFHILFHSNLWFCDKPDARVL